MIRSLTRDGMQELAKPGNKYRRCSARPRSVLKWKCNEVETDTTKPELSQSEIHDDCDCKLDYDQLQEPKASKSVADHQGNDDNLKVTVWPRSILKSRESIETRMSQPKDCVCMRVS